MSSGVRTRGLTLLELLVVITLMSVALGTVVLRLDGVSDTARLRATARQLDAVLRLAQNLARTDGRPRLMEYALNSDRVTVRCPQEREGRWDWDQGTEYQTSTGVRTVRVLFEGQAPEAPVQEHSPHVRIAPDGGFVSHAVVLALHGRFAVLTQQSAGSMELTLRDSAPQAVTFELLRLELEPRP